MPHFYAANVENILRARTPLAVAQRPVPHLQVSGHQVDHLDSLTVPLEPFGAGSRARRCRSPGRMRGVGRLVRYLRVDLISPSAALSLAEPPRGCSSDFSAEG